LSYCIAVEQKQLEEDTAKEREEKRKQKEEEAAAKAAEEAAAAPLADKATKAPPTENTAPHEVSSGHGTSLTRLYHSMLSWK
jgi:hypothetical protein